jgi:6-phosphogluconolactonase
MKAEYLNLIFFLGCLSVFLGSDQSISLKAQTVRFLVGTTNGDLAESLAVCELDENGETMSLVHKLKAGQRPGYIAMHGQHLYAVSTDSQGDDEQTLRAFDLLDHGAGLKQLNEVSSKGVNPCHVSVDASGTNLYTANYSSGGIAQYQIRGDGSLGDNLYAENFTGKSVDPRRQQGSHAHYIHATVDNQFILTADLGTDKVMVHSPDADGKLQVYEKQPYFELPAGSGPRHLEFHPNNQWIYVLNELKSTITKVSYHNGSFIVGETISTLPDDFDSVSYSAAVRIHPLGKIIYSSNRGHDSISVFTIGEEGDLSRVQTFEEGLGWVRDFNVTPSGKFIVAGNEKKNQVVLLKIGDNGHIVRYISSLELPAPSCFVFLN